MIEESYCAKHKIHFGSVKCPMCAASPSKGLSQNIKEAMADISAQCTKSACSSINSSAEGIYVSSDLVEDLVTDKYEETMRETHDMLEKNLTMLDEMRHAVEVEEALRQDSQEFDPTGRDQHEAGAKLDGGKPLAGVLGDFSLALLAVAEVGTYGAKIYSRGGWQSVPDGEVRYFDAEWRHLLKRRHEEYDTDSGLLHDAHRAWNVLAALELKLRRMKGDEK